MEHYRIVLSIISVFAQHFNTMTVNFATKKVHKKVSMWINNKNKYYDGH